MSFRSTLGCAIQASPDLPRKPSLGCSPLGGGQHPKLLHSAFLNLVVFEVVDDAERHSEVFSCRWDSCVLADVLPNYHCLD